MNSKTELHLFFPTPVWTTQINSYESTNLKIYNYIKNLQKNDSEGLNKSNTKGWHSKNFTLTDESVIAFINLLSPTINQTLIDMNWDLKNQETKITSMWSIINKKEASNARHIHGNNFISAAYYVKAPNNCGKIVFYDPRSAPVFNAPDNKGANNLNSNAHSIEPKEGLLVLFPSYLHHSVENNMSEDERIVVSFNINLLTN